MKITPMDDTFFDDGGRVGLRQLTPEDVTDRYLDWFKDRVVTEYLDARNLTRKDVVDYLVNGTASRIHYMFAIVLKESGIHIGNVKIGPINWPHGTSGLVTFIGDREFWGKGLAREAIRIGTRVAFSECGLRKLSDGVADGNIGSLKAYSAAGWSVEGRMKGHHIINGEARDRIVISCFNPLFFQADKGSLVE